jgi:hypothetical protein
MGRRRGCRRRRAGVVGGAANWDGRMGVRCGEAATHEREVGRRASVWIWFFFFLGERRMR